MAISTSIHSTSLIADLSGSKDTHYWINLWYRGSCVGVIHAENDKEKASQLCDAFNRAGGHMTMDEMYHEANVRLHDTYSDLNGDRYAMGDTLRDWLSDMSRDDPRINEVVSKIIKDYFGES